MALWKKILVVFIVLLLVASGATVYILYKYGFFGPSYGDMDGYYLDLEGAAEIGICNVNMGSDDISDAVLSNTMSLADSKGDAAYDSFSGSNNRPVSHDYYLVAPSRVHSQLDHMQNKLFKTDGDGHRTIIKAYKDADDLQEKNDSFSYKQSIVYVEDAGKFILITYYKHNMSDVWNHLNYHGSFWSRDVDYSSALIDK